MSEHCPSPDPHAECGYFYGVPFTDLDARHWLSYVLGELIDQPGKLTVPYVPDQDSVLPTTAEVS